MPTPAIVQVLKKYWGYDDFRPLQAEAMRAVLEQRDSLVVLPTGGGKSLCYQAPAIVMPGTAVVVSPLISLMKDQVDALTSNGIGAACINSTSTADERRAVGQGIRDKTLKLLYLAPERLCTDRTLTFLDECEVSFFAIDEAHCISDWGHDFRPDYRALSLLRTRFPQISVHGYTATATQQVREDIAQQLHLKSPEYLVGSFDRPNLTYRVLPRADADSQIAEILARHKGESGIIYCISRKQTEETAAWLRGCGYKAAPYHAGLPDIERHRTQDAFLQDRIDIVVATVAFGMGIDKSNVRFVIHAGMPRALENYQQESGRAGRDGLEAECCLLYSARDFMTWKKLQSNLGGRARDVAMQSLELMGDYCRGTSCRHKHLVEHFGQPFENESCLACDVCLAELEFVPDALVISQKILSCVARLKQNFGVVYTASVLCGSKESRILENGHDKLSTYGLLTEDGIDAVKTWIDQLISQKHLVRSDDFDVLQITPSGWQVLKGELTPRLVRPQKGKAKRKSAAAQISWAGVDAGLFEELRVVRRQLAEGAHLAPFMVFSDASLREMARRCPGTQRAFRAIPGVGDKKSADYGEQFVTAIVQYCESQGLPLDVPADAPAEANPGAAGVRKVSQAHRQAFELFSRGASVAAVVEQTERAESTILKYLTEYIAAEQLTDPEPWLDRPLFERIRAAVEAVGYQKLRTIFEFLDGAVPYEKIHIAVACMKNLPNAVPTEQ